MDWPELRGNVDIEFRTVSVLPQTSQAVEHNDGTKTKLRAEGAVGSAHRLVAKHRAVAHEVQLNAIRREIELQREAVERILQPTGFEERMKEHRERERVLRAERELKIKERYEKTRLLNEEKALKKKELVAHPPAVGRRAPTVRPLGSLPPIGVDQATAMKELDKARAVEAQLETQKKKQHATVISATKRVVMSILASGVDAKGFVYTEACIVQQFARAAIALRVAHRLTVRSPSPVVLSLISRKGQDPLADARKELAQAVAVESIDNAKILLTKEYVMQDVKNNSLR